jgi:hypothetical protein
VRKGWRTISRLRPFIGQPPTKGFPARPPIPFRVTQRPVVVTPGIFVRLGNLGSKEKFSAKGDPLRISARVDNREIRGRVVWIRPPFPAVTFYIKPLSVYSGDQLHITGEVFKFRGPRREAWIVRPKPILVLRGPDPIIPGRFESFRPPTSFNLQPVIVTIKPLRVSWRRDSGVRGREGQALKTGPRRQTFFDVVDRGLDTFYGHHTEIRGKVFRWRPKTANPAVTGSLNHGLIRLTNFTISLNVKREVDSGDVNALSSDSGGTQVNFNKDFKDIDSITCTVDSVTEPFIVIYDFTDIPNPTGFKVYVFDTTGNRVSKLVSWKARGIV